MGWHQLIQLDVSSVQCNNTSTKEKWVYKIKYKQICKTDKIIDFRLCGFVAQNVSKA